MGVTPYSGPENARARRYCNDRSDLGCWDDCVWGVSGMKLDAQVFAEAGESQNAPPYQSFPYLTKYVIYVGLGDNV